MAGKAKELAELNRLNGQIHAQQNKADKIYMEIGIQQLQPRIYVNVLPICTVLVYHFADFHINFIRFILLK